jgi:hypothetical protein
MRLVFGKQFRAVVLTLACSATLAPFAAGAPARDQDVSMPAWRDAPVRIVRAIREVAKKKFGALTSNADSLAIPRP